MWALAVALRYIAELAGMAVADSGMAVVGSAFVDSDRVAAGSDSAADSGAGSAALATERSGIAQMERDGLGRAGQAS
jgi:hypothetical protein